MAEPETAYRYLHEDAPVHFFEAFEPPFYTLSRHRDVQAALLDIETYSSEFGQGPRGRPWREDWRTRRHRERWGG